MQGTEYKTKEQILKRANEAIGIPLKDIDKTGRLKKGKGAIGIVIEESWFGYSPNSEAEPDFSEAKVELKVTPYTRGRDGKIRAKERLVCNIINYMEEYDKTFETSSFWHKCETMLLMSYEHIKDVSKGEFKIDKAVLFSFPEKDLVIIENDWKTIMDKVRKGEAHLISEGDTMYLAACTKGENASSVRPQPCSDIPAKQRAYSLKASYMTQILNQYIFGTATNERIITDWKQLQKHSFEDIIVEKLRPYFGNTQEQLKKMFDLEECNAKNINEILLAKMLGIKGKIAYTDEFQKACIVPKTIRVQHNGKIKESMSFPTFDFIKLSKEAEWEESELYNYIAPTKFLFVIFQENDDGEYVFERVKFWNIPNDDLEEVQRVWERTVQTIRRGVTLRRQEGAIYNDLPKQSDSQVAHVRPHSNRSAYKLLDGTIIGDIDKDANPLPDGRWMTKQCFWFNRTYVEKQIKE